MIRAPPNTRAIFATDARLIIQPIRLYTRVIPLNRHTRPVLRRVGRCRMLSTQHQPATSRVRAPAQVRDMPCHSSFAIITHNSATISFTAQLPSGINARSNERGGRSCGCLRVCLVKGSRSSSQVNAALWKRLTADKIFIQLHDPPHESPSILSFNDLERQFCAAADAKNATKLRQAAVLADIGECILFLDSKLRLYDRDCVSLKSTSVHMQLIKQHAVTQGHTINFLGLELFRSQKQKSIYGESFIQANSLLRTSTQDILDLRQEAIQVAHHFISDPFSLVEHRLPLITR